MIHTKRLITSLLSILLLWGVFAIIDGNLNTLSPDEVQEVISLNAPQDGMVFAYATELLEGPRGGSGKGVAIGACGASCPCGTPDNGEGCLVCAPPPSSGSLGDVTTSCVGPNSKASVTLTFTGSGCSGAVATPELQSGGIWYTIIGVPSQSLECSSTVTFESLGYSTPTRILVSWNGTSLSAETETFTSADCTPPPAPSVPGSCGGAATSYTWDEAFPDGAYCSAGTQFGAANPPVGGSDDWTCSGSGGGDPASCTATRDSAPVDGLCGGAEQNYVYNASGYSGSFCSAGSASPASPAFPSQGGSSPWTCDGAYGGDSDPCTATRNVAPQCDNDLDDDEDGKPDILDPGCHSDGDPNDGDDTYEPSDNDETDPPATVFIEADPSILLSGKSADIIWSANNVTSCIVSGPSGLFDSDSVDPPFVNISEKTKSTGAVTAEQIYTLSCLPAGVGSTKIATVKILPINIEEI